MGGESNRRDHRRKPLGASGPKPRRVQAPGEAFAETEPDLGTRRVVHFTKEWQAPPARMPVHTLKSRLNHFAIRYPARLTVIVFAVLIFVITGLLLLPISNASGTPTPFVDAFFTAVSSVCVTGLTVVDTALYWSFFGQVVLAIAISLGGLGVMTMASLLALVVSRRLGLTSRLLNMDAVGGNQTHLGDAWQLVIGVLVTTITVEAALFLLVFPAFAADQEDVGQAAWNALFMSISAFNNAGFVNLPDGLTPYIGNWFVLFPLMLATVIGAIGFPVIVDLKRHWRAPRTWTLHTKITLTTYFGLLVITGIVVAALEWTNPYTFGPLNLSEKLLNSIVAAVNPRSVGISVIDVSQMTGASWLITDMSMFIGGGSGSHAGGVKVTTFTILLLAAWAEARGDHDVQTFGRRIPRATVRQSIAVLLMASLLVASVTVILLMITPFTLDRVLFEVISAFGTVGLSTGITSALPSAAKILVAFLMVTGRVGPMTFAAALALRQRKSFIRLPEERPIVG